MPHSLQITPEPWHLLHNKCHILQVLSVLEGNMEWESGVAVY